MSNRDAGAVDPWRLRGTSLQLAAYVAAGFVGAALLAAAVDIYADRPSDSSLLQTWTLMPQALVAAGLIYIGKVRTSGAFWALGSLIGLVFIEEAFHVLNPVEISLRGLVDRLSERLGADPALINGLLVYGLVALIGLIFLAYALAHASKPERRVVRNIALLLAVGWLFGGPIAVVSNSRDNRLWMFVEEIAEAAVFAVLAGYVCGLIYAAGYHAREPARKNSA